MNPIYKFYLNKGTDDNQVFPMYSEDLAKTYEKEMNEVFFRTGLSGDLTFVAQDYDWIVAQAFDFKFILTINISHDAGQTWELYWTGVFYKTDCTFDGFKRTVVVRPEAYDQYTDFLPLLDKQFNIVNLAPAIRRTFIDKPAMLQVYNAGDDVITCVIPGRSWEQECEIINANDTVAGQNRLTEYLHFALLSNGVYARLLTDATTVSSQQTYELPIDDIVSSRRTHKRVLPYTRVSSFTVGQYYTTEPTKYGMYDSTQYYAEPPGSDYLPVVRSKWDANSYWFKFASEDRSLFADALWSFELLLNYDLFSVLQRLLAASGSGIEHMYSEFFTDANNPITEDAQMRYTITPKSNVMVGGDMTYQAQKGDLSLRDFFDLMRDCFRCYWFIDENNILHIEHIKYFMNGGSYQSSPGVDVDLISLVNPRSGKTLAYGQEQYKFDKPAMAARYTFAWKDEVTQPFTGYPIEIVSNYVDKTKSEEIKLSKFTSDIDYLLLAGDIDKDGFAIMNISDSGLTIDSTLYWNNLQNGYLSFDYLQKYYFWDMSARWYSINGNTYQSLGVKKLKLQEVSFPALNDPDPSKLVRTLLGYGAVEKMSVSLSSRNVKATLAYDTE